MNHKTVLFPGDAQRLLLEANSGGIPEESPPAPGSREVSESLSVKRIVMLGLLETFRPGPLRGSSLSLDFPLLPEKTGPLLIKHACHLG